MNMTDKELLEIAIRACIDAGKKILSVYDSDDFEIEHKSDASPLTKADLLAHQCILEHLEKTNIPILSEEGAAIPYSQRAEWKNLWIVDPLDGTKEFIKRNGEFTVNIALIKNGAPFLGVVYVPVANVLYWGMENYGSFCYTIEEKQPLLKMDNDNKLPKTKFKSHFTIVASRSHLSDETADFISNLKEIHGEIEIVSKGSSLKLCMVAEGAADCYPRFAPTMEWDIAAGHAICKFSGKKVMDLDTNSEMIYNRENLLNNWFIVD
jgi:3'(2'), 5'-bisphosphate nucleotidase